MDLAAPRQGGRFFSKAFGRDFPRLPSRKTMDSRTPGPQSQPPSQKSSSDGRDSDQQPHPSAKFVPSRFERSSTNTRLSEGEEAGDGIVGLHSKGGSTRHAGFSATKVEKATSGSLRRSLKKKTAAFARPHIPFSDSSLLQDADVASYASNPSAAAAGGCGSYDFPEPASQVDQLRLRDKLAQLLFQESMSDLKNDSGSDGENKIDEGGGGGHCPLSFSSSVAPTFSVVDPEDSWEASWERAVDGDLICGSDVINSHNVLRIPRDVFASRSRSVCPSPAGPPSRSFRSIFSSSSQAELSSGVGLHGPMHADGTKAAAAAASAGIGASAEAPGGGAESASAAAENTVVLEEGDHQQVTPHVPSASTATITAATSSSHSSRPCSPLICVAATTPSSSPSPASTSFPGSSPASTAPSEASHCIGFPDASPGPSFASNSELKVAPVLLGSKAPPQQGYSDFAGVPRSVSAAAIPHRKSLSTATTPRLASAASVSILPSFEQRRRLAVEAEAEDARQCQVEAPRTVDVSQRQTPSATAEAAAAAAEGAVAVECQTARQSQAVAAAAALQAHKGTREGLRDGVRRGYTMPLERSRDAGVVARAAVASAAAGHGRSLTVSSVEQDSGAAAQANADPVATVRSQFRSKTAPCEREEGCRGGVVLSRVYPGTVGAKASAAASTPRHRLPSLWVSIPEACPEEEAVVGSDLAWGPQTVDRSSSLNCGSSRACLGGCLEGLSLSVAGKGNEGKGMNVGAREGAWGPQTMDRSSSGCHRRLRVWDGFEGSVVVEREDAWAVAP